MSIFGTGNIDTAIDMDDALSSYYTNVTIDQMFSNLNNIYIPLTNIYSINVLYENIDTPSLAVVSADRYNTMLNNYVYNYLLENYIEEYVLTTDDTIRVNTTYYILTDGVYVDSGLVYDDTDGADNTLPTGIDYYVIQQISQGLPASTNKLAPIFAAKVHTHTPDEVGTTGFITVDVPDLTHYYTSSVIDNKLNSLAPLSSLSNYVSCSDLEDTGIFPNVMYSDMLSDEVSIDPDTDEEIVPTVTSKNINTYTTQGNYFFTTAVTNGPSIDTTLLAYPSTDTGLLQVYTTVTQTVTDDTTTTVDNNTFYVITQVFIDDNQNTYTRSATNHYDVVIDPVIDDETLFDEDGNEIEPEVDGTDYVLEFTTWCDTYEVDYTWTQEQVSTHFSTVIEYIFTTDETFGSSKEYYVYANDSYVLVDLADEESDVTYGDEIPADTYYEIKSTDAWVEEWNSYYSNVTIYLSNIYTWSNWICSMSTNTIGSRIWISDLTDCVCTYLQDTYETATGTYQTEVSYYSREHDGNVYVYTKLDTSSLTGTDIPDGVYIWNATTQNYIDFSIPDSISAQVNTLTSVAQVILECVSTTTDYAIGDTITDPICSNRAYNDSSFLGTAQVGIVTTDGSKRVRVYLPLVWYVKRKNSYTEVYESMTCPLYTSTDIAAWNLRVKLTY